MRNIEIRRPIDDRPRKPTVLLVGNPGIPASLLVTGLEEKWGSKIEQSRLNSARLGKTFDGVRPEILLMRVPIEGERDEFLRNIRQLASAPTHTKIVVLADRFDARLAIDCFRCGARGFIEEAGQNAEALGKCIVCVKQGQFWISNDLLAEVMKLFSRPPERVVSLSICGDVLSPREKEVMGLVIEGMGNREIADTLRISENTVKKYVYSIFNKRGVSSRVGLLRQAFQHERESA